MIECIVLAGGLGTRLSSVVSDVPKCMAPVAGKPFLAHLLNYLESQFVDHVILSLGYKAEVVIDYLRNKAYTFKVSWVIEKDPLGTGGGIKLALGKCKTDSVFVLNGDTMFKVDMRGMLLAKPDNVAIIMALKPMHNYERYGTVLLNEQGRVIAFQEKQYKESGLINGGVYLCKNLKEALSNYASAFSFERDFLELQMDNYLMHGFESDAYFIDIGIPEDYAQAQIDFRS
jgi:D-glycero-alpha-D-manno-heptose 1-phosphate guanylyltransferase